MDTMNYITNWRKKFLKKWNKNYEQKQEEKPLMKADWIFFTKHMTKNMAHLTIQIKKTNKTFEKKRFHL